MKPAGRLQSDSFDVMLAEVYPACISVAYAATGEPLEVVIKPRAECGKSSGGLEAILQDLGIAISRILQGRHPGDGGETRPRNDGGGV